MLMFLKGVGIAIVENLCRWLKIILKPSAFIFFNAKLSLYLLGIWNPTNLSGFS